MKEIRLKSVDQITNLFNLLKIDDQKLKTVYDQLILICSKKEWAILSGRNEQATFLQTKELKSIQKIVSLLKKEGIFKGNFLNIQFLEPEL